jgi:hypothetical protein
MMMMMMTSRGCGGASLREAVLTNLWPRAESAAAHIRPVSGRQAELAPDCLLDQAGTLLNIWPYFHHGRTRDCSAEWKACVLDLRLDQKIDGASGCTPHALRRFRVIPWKLGAPHAVLLGCTI